MLLTDFAIFIRRIMPWERCRNVRLCGRRSANLRSLGGGIAHSRAHPFADDAQRMIIKLFFLSSLLQLNFGVCIKCARSHVNITLKLHWDAVRVSISIPNMMKSRKKVLLLWKK